MPPSAPDKIAQAIAQAEQWREQNAQRRPTINDVARLAQVSKKTVSRVFNNAPDVSPQTRDLVNATIKTLKYRPDPQARGLAFRHSFLVGMIYDNPNPQYVLNMQQGILDGLHGTDYQLVLLPCERGQKDTARTVKAFAERLNLYSAILTPSVSENDDVARALSRIDCRYVRIASIFLDAADKMVVTHDCKGGVAAAKHLLDLGHRRIGFLTGLSSFRSAFERRAGFEDALIKNGIRLQPEHIFQGDYTYASGVACGQALAAMHDPPTALYAANDEMALGVLHALLEKGLHVPQFMSVVGYDDFQMAARCFPTLSTVRIPIREIGRQAALKALDMDTTETTAHTPQPIEPMFMARGSSGPPTR